MMLSTVTLITVGSGFVIGSEGLLLSPDLSLRVLAALSF